MFTSGHDIAALHLRQEVSDISGVGLSAGGDGFSIFGQKLLEMIEADNEIPVSTMHVDCAKTLKIVINDLEAKGEAEPGAGFARPIRLDSAGWVANRWCEILPIPLKARQKLMELDDPGSRLTIVHQYLQQHQII